MLGRAATGVDLSPLALRIAEVHCELRAEAERAALLSRRSSTWRPPRSSACARASSRARRCRRASARSTSRTCCSSSPVCARRSRASSSSADRRALEIVLSSLLVKFSRQRADTSEEQAQKRLRKGLATEFFAAQGQRAGRALGRCWPGAAARQVRGAGAVAARRCARAARAARPRRDVRSRGELAAVRRHVRLPRASRAALSVARHRRAAARARRGRRAPAPVARLPDGAARWERELGGVLAFDRRASARAARASRCCSGDAQVGGQARRRRRAARAPRAARRPARSSPALRTTRSDFTGGAARREHLVLLSKS